MIDSELLELRATVVTAADAAAEKLAGDVLILEISEMSSIGDYFLICTGATSKQTKAICDEVRKTMREHGLSPLRSAGEDMGEWIVLDYGDFMVHIFTPEKRDYYQLERLWQDAPQVDLGQA